MIRPPQRDAPSEDYQRTAAALLRTASGRHADLAGVMAEAQAWATLALVAVLRETLQLIADNLDTIADPKAYPPRTDP